MLRRALSSALQSSARSSRAPITVTAAAWAKMGTVLRENRHHAAFLFAATGGGCGGFNYQLRTIGSEDLAALRQPILMEHATAILAIDPPSEMLLLGTTVDYVQEDYAQQQFESKFTFTPRADLASSCGCGISFAPRGDIDDEEVGVGSE